MNDGQSTLNRWCVPGDMLRVDAGYGVALYREAEHSDLSYEIIPWKSLALVITVHHMKHAEARPFVLVKGRLGWLHSTAQLTNVTRHPRL